MSGKPKGIAHEIIANIKLVADNLGAWPKRDEYYRHPLRKFTKDQLEDVFKTWGRMNMAAGKAKIIDYVDEGDGPRVLYIDIETFPAEYRAYQPKTDYLRRDQMIKDVAMRSWCAKWHGDKKLIYRDTRNERDPRDASKILPELWKLMDEADIIIGQNGNRFDIPKIQGWFMFFKTMDRKPPSPFKKVDTKLIVKKHFGLTYNSLEHMCEFFGVEHKKLKHERFPGLELPIQCEAGNLEAWKENEEYNKNDVLCLEDCWTVMRAWDSSINQNLYTGSKVSACNQPGCGGEYVKNGFHFSNVGKFQRYACQTCGHPARGRENLLSKRKKENLRNNIPR